MKIILDKHEIYLIIGKHFGAELKEEQVSIRTTPELELEISGLKVNENPEPVPVARKVAEEAAPDDTSIEDVLKESEQVLQRSDRNVLRSVPEDSSGEV